MREIHSTLAESCRKKDFYFTIGTLILVSSTTFLGFSGIESRQILLSDAESHKNLSTFIFNFLVFIVFLMSLLNLVFRWKENHTLHFQGVVRLTDFIVWLDKEILLIKSFDELLINKICSKYQAIIDILPPNDDNDYINAKKSLNRKSLSNPTQKECCYSLISVFTKQWHFRKCSYLKGQEFFENLIFSSARLLPILRAMRTTDTKLWLGGGAIRNYIWDSLTGRTTATDDLDVIYFDKKNSDEDSEEELKRKLIEKTNNSLNWSVKNQVRMYKNNTNEIVDNLEAAIANWPETSTAIAIRLDKLDRLQIIAPCGFDDLLSLTLRPTPAHKFNPEIFERRVKEKKWLKLWPELKIEMN